MPGERTPKKAAEAWTAVVLSAWSSAELATHYKVGDAALQRAWSHFTPAQRQAFEADESKPPDTERANVASMTRELGLTTPEATDLLIFWSTLHNSTSRRWAAGSFSPCGRRN